MTHRPIGYWLKELDRLIDAALDGALAEEGVTRRHWQVPNLLADAPASRAALERDLAPFWTAKSPTLDGVLAASAAAGW